MNWRIMEKRQTESKRVRLQGERVLTRREVATDPEILDSLADADRRKRSPYQRASSGFWKRES